MRFEIVVVTLLVIIVLVVSTRKVDNIESIRGQLVAIEREMDSLDRKLNIILNELGYEVRPR